MSLLNKGHSFTRGHGLLESFLAKKRAQLANKFIPPRYRKGRILDIGCGSFPLFLVSTQFHEKYGLDPNANSNLIKSEKIKLEKISISKKRLPFKDNFFDVVVMLAVFEHLEEDTLPSTLMEVNRILKRGGIFIITTPAPWSDKLLHWTARLGLISQEEIHDHKHNQPKLAISSLIEQANFSSNNIKSGFFELGFNMWFVAKK